MKRSLLVLLCAASVLVSCRHENETVLPDLSQQVEALLDSMTVDEKIGQLMNATPGIERLGIKPYDWWNEGLHGVGRNGRATVFPQPIGLAASFDTLLLRKIGDAIAEEARAKFNVAQRLGNYGRNAGLTFCRPTSTSFATRAGAAAWRPTARIPI